MTYTCINKHLGRGRRATTVDKGWQRRWENMQKKKAPYYTQSPKRLAPTSAASSYQSLCGSGLRLRGPKVRVVWQIIWLLWLRQGAGVHPLTQKRPRIQPPVPSLTGSPEKRADIKRSGDLWAECTQEECMVMGWWVGWRGGWARMVGALAPEAGQKVSFTLHILGVRRQLRDRKSAVR